MPAYWSLIMNHDMSNPQKETSTNLPLTTENQQASLLHSLDPLGRQHQRSQD